MITDHLHQAADDIINILTQPPLPTVPSLVAGDPVQNALLAIANQLKRAEPIPDPLPSKHPITLPRVEHETSPKKDNAIPPTRVGPNTSHLGVDNTQSHWRAEPPQHIPNNQHTTSLPVSVLLQHSKSPKNNSYRNTGTHKYSLCSTE